MSSGVNDPFGLLSPLMCGNATVTYYKFVGGCTGKIDFVCPRTRRGMSVSISNSL